MSVVNSQSNVVNIQSAQSGLDVFVSKKAVDQPALPHSGASATPQLPSLPASGQEAIGGSANHGTDSAAEKSLAEQHKQASAALDAILKKLEPTPKTLDFSVNRKLNQIVIRVIDARTHKVVSEIPAEAILKMQEHLQSLDAKKIPVGSLLSEQA